VGGAHPTAADNVSRRDFARVGPTPNSIIEPEEGTAMRRFRVRVSIAGLMALVLFVAVGVAALREASEVWSGALFALTVAAMAFAGLRAAYREGARRAFWAGFAVFGSIYLALAFAPGAESRPALVSQRFLTWLHSKVGRDSPTTATITLTRGFTFLDGSGTVIGNADHLAMSSTPVTVTTSTAPATWVWPTTTDPMTFARVGHCLLAVVVAMLGGVVARRQWATGTHIAAIPPPTTPEDPPCPAAVS
jgi:hypothetical protein